MILATSKPKESKTKGARSRKQEAKTYPEDPNSPYNAQILPRSHGLVGGLHVARRGTFFGCERAVAGRDAFVGGFGWHV